MRIFETIKSPLTGEQLYFSKDSLTLYTSKEVVQAYGQQAMDVLSRTGEVIIEVNATPLSHKFQKNEGSPTRDKHSSRRTRR